MKTSFVWRSIMILAMLVVASALVHAQSLAPGREPSKKLASATGGPQLPVIGGGTVGRLTKWTGFTSSNSVIGDTNIFEDKFGKVGIGTDAPASTLTVVGMIQTTLGGYKFPDGTVQTTAGVSPSEVVGSLNGLRGDLTLAAGSNITIESSGNTLTVSAPNTLSAVSHDSTMFGNGTSGSPLGVAVPLSLSGAVQMPNPILNIINSASGGIGVTSLGGDNASGFGGVGMIATGGISPIQGGRGLIARGGNGGTGGPGLVAEGGTGQSNQGGDGVSATGGSSTGVIGGVGLVSSGGNSDTGPGGVGVLAFGGSTASVAAAGIGILAIPGTGPSPGLAGKFDGDVSIARTCPSCTDGNLDVAGNLNVLGGTKNFKIDHPLDPENKYLYHAAIESSEVFNLYSGTVTTNENGDAAITLPDWFEAINRDFRYQLTVIGTFAQAIVSAEIKNNRFSIKTTVPNVKVSWQVTGVRSDAAMRTHAFKTEEDKPESERGYFLTPDAYGKPEELGIEWARHPEIMRRVKQLRDALTQHSRTKDQ